MKVFGQKGENAVFKTVFDPKKVPRFENWPQWILSNEKLVMKPFHVVVIKIQHQTKFKQLVFTKLKLESRIRKIKRKDQFVNTNRHLYNGL